MMVGVLKLANVKNVPEAAGFRVFTAMRLNEETTAGPLGRVLFSSLTSIILRNGSNIMGPFLWKR
jgi:hypothetical protein